MALKTITGKVAGPDGTNKAASITATLNVPTIIAGTQETVPSLVKTVAASDGTYTLTLQANNDMTPTGNYYTITESSPDGGFYQFTIIVPQTAGPFIMSNLLGAIPALTPGPGHVADLTVDNSFTVTNGPLVFPLASIPDSALSANVGLVTAAQTVAYAASLTINATAGEAVVIGALTGNITINAPTNSLSGRRLELRFLQDATGGRTVTWNAVFKFSPQTWQPNPAASTSSTVAFVCDGTNWQQFTTTPVDLAARSFTSSSSPYTPNAPVGGIFAAGDAYFQSGIPWHDLHADAVGDLLTSSDLSCTSGSPTVTSAAGKFTAAMTGKLFDLGGGTGPGITGSQVGTITYVSATQATLSVNANANATNATLAWGTDDTTAVQTWVNRTGGVHRISGGTYFVTGTVTVPNGAKFVGDRVGTLWASARLGAGHMLNMDACLAGPNAVGINFYASLGFTGRFITCSSANEAATDFLLRDVTTFSPNDGADYHILLNAVSGTASHITVNANNKLSNKALSISSAISLSKVVDSVLIGRCYSNAQAFNYSNCTTGPLRVANNSANDGSGTAQQVNTVTVDGGYTYSSNSGGTEFPCIESVVATSTGEGAAGGTFPNINSNGTFFVFGAGAALSQNAVSGGFTASQGSTGAVFKSCGFVQSATSPATTVTIVNSTGGAPPIYITACSANIIGAVVTARVFNVVAGTGECMVSDFMPSGQATVWQHPTVSTQAPTIAAFPASGTAVRNVYASAYDLWLGLNGAVLTAVAISKDNSTYVNVYSDGAAVASRAALVFRWPAGSWIKLTYTTATPNYILVPAP